MGSAGQSSKVGGYFPELYVPIPDEHPINSTNETGELVALMGPSGCGKTTLLNVLARRAASSGAKTTGDGYIDGKTVDNATFGRLTSYVEQEDALIGSLTVRETLKFAADLSLPRCVLS